MFRRSDEKLDDLIYGSGLNEDLVEVFRGAQLPVVPVRNIDIGATSIDALFGAVVLFKGLKIERQLFAICFVC